MFKKLLESKNHMDIYIIARWCYHNGKYVFKNDNDFDKFEEVVKRIYPDQEIYKRSYSDDTEPTELLKKYDINLDLPTSEITTRIAKYNDILTDNKGISVRPIRTYQEAYEWHQANENKEIVYSIKMNGVHVKMLLNVETSQVVVASSKASQTDNFIDYTEAVTSHLPRLRTNLYKNKAPRVPNLVPVMCEAYVTEKGLRDLREQYGIKYVTGRSGAIGVMRRNLVSCIPDEFKLTAFTVLDNSNTMTESLDNAKRVGFDTVEVITETYTRRSFEQFCEYIDDIQESLTQYAEQENIPYDGVVAQINQTQEYYSNYTDLYNDSNIALKLGATGAQELTATVSRVALISGMSSTTKVTPKIFLEPTITKDGVTIKEISGYTLGNIIERGIKRGSTVTVIYQSGCYPTLK